MIKEKLLAEFIELRQIYIRAYNKAKEIPNNEISLKNQVSID